MLLADNQTWFDELTGKTYDVGGIMGSMFSPVIDFSSGSGGGWGSVLSGIGDLATQFLYSQVPVRTGPGNVSQYPTVGGLPVPGAGGNIPVPRTGIPGIPLPNKVGFAFGRKKYRHMNACNPRALKRAIRRVKRFEKFAKQSVKISSHVKTSRRRTSCR